MSEHAIREIVDRETRAWDAQNVELLLSIFHRDFVWPWPPHGRGPRPARARVGHGPLRRGALARDLHDLFAADELVHNRRRTPRVSLSAKNTGGLAVV